MDVTGLLAVSDAIAIFKKFLNNEHLKCPLFINLYSDNSKITFDITPIVLKTHKWVYNRLISEISKGSGESFPVLPSINDDMYKEYLSDEFGSDRVIVSASYADASKAEIKYTKDVTDWLYVVFERIGFYLKEELFNMHNNLFDSIKHVSNSLHTLKVF